MNPTIQEDLLAGVVRESVGSAAPLVLRAVDRRDWLGWLRAHAPRLQHELLRTGAILFRDFGFSTTQEFEQAAEVLCPELYQDYGDLPREGESKVYRSTPYPAQQTILFHHEASHTDRWPLKQWFFCVTPPESGGRTPIVDGRAIYANMNPRLRSELEAKGIMYVRHFIEGFDVSWQDFFKTSSRSDVQAQCRQRGMGCTWKGEVLQTAKVCPAVARHPITGDVSFFNQLQLHHVACLPPKTRTAVTAMFGEGNLPRSACFGDGTPIPDAAVEELVELYWRQSTAFTWRQGDVLLVDNFLMAHAREPFTGPRKIVVAMGQMCSSATQPLDA
jgi:alpha-ketoglutarate-dependent taurine dioxygenase